jgi:hypothetical protein
MLLCSCWFTQQMGSDFDVDKFYTNTFATYYDKATGKQN